jgi:hypothetical protein
VNARIGRLASDTEHALDDLELELRKLPGVRAAGFEERDDMLLIQLHVGESTDPYEQPVPIAATRIAARHWQRPVAVEVVRWRSAPAARNGAAPRIAPTPVSTDIADGTTTGAPRATSAEPGGELRRPRLLAVLAFPDTDELEVHLIYEGKRTIGRAAASAGLAGAVEATLDAVRALGSPFESRAKWARALDETDDDRAVVAVALEGIDDDPFPPQYGLAAGASPIDAAARSTLDALNRRLSRAL